MSEGCNFENKSFSVKVNAPDGSIFDKSCETCKNNGRKICDKCKAWGRFERRKKGGRH